MAKRKTQAKGHEAPTSVPAAPGSVIVGCKLPAGLLLTLGDTKVRLNGTASLLPVGMELPLITDRYAYTSVNADFWDTWLASYSCLDIVQKGIVFACPNAKAAESEGTNRRDVASGFEGIDPENPALKSGVAGISKADVQAS